MRYFKKLTHKQIERLWGFRFPLPPSYDGKELFLRVRKSGAASTRYSSLILLRRDLREDDVILNEHEEVVEN